MPFRELQCEACEVSVLDDPSVCLRECDHVLCNGCAEDDDCPVCAGFIPGTDEFEAFDSLSDDELFDDDEDDQEFEEEDLDYE